ncbi:small ribosomal subunit Rsm22 family protein [Streptomyces sp. MnatMP-M17]|uniref:small ribosomal subunit Rsm22 family protein n=1 Tax=unclassified Streptomyces TaxID=2593676 RepID=UPI00081DE128|nr:small ribosomal subunit Rsm22 family protein [Streptomyces sp. MnatMP-M17]MYZ35794.1 rRNA methyltransferase [Streptomyces sp. SID4917]SCF78439.1 Ribosomal protein RSM22 (predicted rRNA methylase) [Streptomyces sp. MnatMP-M17]
MNATLPTAEALRAALAGLLDGLPPRQAAQAVERLIVNYRGATPTDAPVLRDRSDVAAYAAYRMPATFEAVRAALEALADTVPDWMPGSHVDVGGGTGAAVWAAEAVWADDPGLDGGRTTAVLDWAEPALALGRELAAASGARAVRAADWRRTRIGTALKLPESDLVTVSYVLKELTERDRAALVAEAARAAEAVVIVEPGTPDGYLRIIEARDRLIEAGLRIAAPCPHGGACPIERGTDWCHFAARVSRSSLHRQVKGGSLPYEDEKFSYVAAVRFEAPTTRTDRADGTDRARVVRKPQIRKGQVLLDLCTEDDGLRRETVTKRHGPLYRAARDTAWGDTWPSPSTTDGTDATDVTGGSEA